MSIFWGCDACSIFVMFFFCVCVWSVELLKADDRLKRVWSCLYLAVSIFVIVVACCFEDYLVIG